MIFWILVTMCRILSLCLAFSISLTYLSVCMFVFGHFDMSEVNSNGNVKKELGVKKEEASKDDQLSLDAKEWNIKEEVSKDGKTNGKRAQTFTFDELAAATDDFRSDCFLGEGGFGKVYKGHLEKINQVCAAEFKLYH